MAIKNSVPLFVVFALGIVGFFSPALAASTSKKSFHAQYNELKENVKNQITRAEMSNAAVKLGEFCQRERQEQVRKLTKKYAKQKAELEKLDKSWADYLASLRKFRAAAKPAKDRGTMGNIEDEMADAEECLAFVNNLNWFFD